MSESAFDRLAATYDEDFTATPIAAYLRGVAQQRLAQLVQPGARVLELGCGTGEDARAVARMGAHVTATDASAAMLAITAEKTRGLSVTTAHLDLNAPEASDVGGVFDGVYSNFGALNCALDRGALAAWLAQRIRAGGWAAFAVMGPLCLWELLWHGAHGQFRTATRRWRPSQFQIDDSPPVTVTCPAPRQLTREFAPHFQTVSVRPLGMFVPHTAAYPVVEKRPRLLQRLLTLDKITQDAPLLALFGDHYWVTLRRNHE
jgi:SAM-dependent methyltransferase